jgi:competence protein ComEA
MDGKSTFPQFFLSLRKYWLAIALALLGLIFLVYGLISLLGSSTKKDEIKLEHQELSPKSTTLIQVDIEGAVVNPGVYKLGTDSIVQDALVASGGLAPEADREYISKNINLASKLSDGAKIYIPKIGEKNEVSVVTDGNIATGLININTASKESLDTLPGVGSVTADKIISNRPYQQINDLLEKSIVSSKVFTQIKDRITTY